MNELCMMAISTAAKAILVPAVTFVVGLLIMRVASGHRYVRQQLRERATPPHHRQLNMRLCGYDATAVGRHWGVLDARALEIERRFLLWDLAFPLAYGWAFVVALQQTWAALDNNLPLLLFLIPVGITVIADWTENLIHLAQLKIYAERGMAGLDPGRIRVASIATSVKLSFFFGTFFLIVVLAVCVICSANCF